MDYIEKALEKLREWVDRIIDALLGQKFSMSLNLSPFP